MCIPSTWEWILSCVGNNTMHLLEICRASSVWCAEEDGKEMIQTWENALVQKSDSSCLNTEVCDKYTGCNMRGGQHRAPWLLLEIGKLWGTFIWSGLRFTLGWGELHCERAHCSELAPRGWWLGLYSQLLGRSTHLARYIHVRDWKSSVSLIHQKQITMPHYQGGLCVKTVLFPMGIFKSRQKWELTGVGWSQICAKKIQNEGFCVMNKQATAQQ